MLKSILYTLIFLDATLSAMSISFVQNYGPQFLGIHLNQTTINEFVRFHPQMQLQETSAYNASDPTLKIYCAFFKNICYNPSDTNSPSPVFICARRYYTFFGPIEIILGVGYFFRDSINKNESMFIKILRSLSDDKRTYYLYTHSRNCFEFSIANFEYMKKHSPSTFVYKEAVFIDKRDNLKISVQKIVSSRFQTDVLLSFERQVNNGAFYFY